MLKVEPQPHNAPPEHCYACLGTADRRAARRKTHKVRRAARARLEIAIYLLFYAVTVENSEVVLRLPFLSTYGAKMQSQELAL